MADTRRGRRNLRMRGKRETVDLKMSHTLFGATCVCEGSESQNGYTCFTDAICVCTGSKREVVAKVIYKMLDKKDEE